MVFSIKVDSDKEYQRRSFDGLLNEKAYQNFSKLTQTDPKNFTFIHEEDQLIFKKNWCHTICIVNSQVQLRPMRYGLIKKGEEFQFQDGLTQIEKENLNQEHIQMRAVIAAKNFTLFDQNSKLILNKKFKQDEYHYIPIIYANWMSADKGIIIQSFALVCQNSTPLLLEKNEALEWINRSKLL
ncbi:MAG: hypothetical protein N4A33_03570 [Bacteriovoracaceae bacterium]|jgi:hypothetical protein|nr:hypothetical protein [Bacteriovoracaceae bacterium]